MLTRAPLVAIGGSSAAIQFGMEAFQEMDQVAVFRPVTKWAERVLRRQAHPRHGGTAFRQATAGRPGPVYLDLPGDVLGEKIEEASVTYSAPWKPSPRSLGDPAAIQRGHRAAGAGAAAAHHRRQRRVVVRRRGGAAGVRRGHRRALLYDADLAGPHSRRTITWPFSTPGCAPSRRPICSSWSGTRFNYIIQFGRPPRFATDLKVVQVDVDAARLGGNRPVEVPVVGDARAVLEQLTAEAAGKVDPARFRGWVSKLRVLDAEKQAEMDKAMSTEQVPIHPLRLCKEVRDFLRRDAILVVDGQEILNFGRQSIPTYMPGHRLNSGSFGCMGVGLPFAIGAKVARPDTQVVALHGDGSFGINAMEIDTAVRHNIPVMVVISNNGGWTADPQQNKPGRNLGYTRYDRVAKELGAHGEFVEKPNDIRPALERAWASGKPAVVNVITDFRFARHTVRFSAYTTLIDMGGLERAPQAPQRSARPGEPGAPLGLTRAVGGSEAPPIPHARGPGRPGRSSGLLGGQLRLGSRSRRGRGQRLVEPRLTAR